MDWEEDFHSDSELYYPREVGIGNTGSANIESAEVRKGYLFYNLSFKVDRFS